MQEFYLLSNCSKIIFVISSKNGVAAFSLNVESADVSIEYSMIFFSLQAFCFLLSLFMSGDAESQQIYNKKPGSFDPG
jgi:hypothetical protein